MNCADILLGSAHLPAHTNGGWALPGGGRTDDRAVALEMAQKMAALIGEKTPLRSFNPPVELKRRRSRVAVAPGSTNATSSIGG